MTNQDQANQGTKADKLDTVRFHFIKSNDFRVIHVDGAHGGPSPRGYFQMALYSERRPIPLRTTHAILDDGTLGDERDRTVRDGFVREIECLLMMDLSTLKSLHEWIGNRLTDLTAEDKATQQ